MALSEQRKEYLYEYQKTKLKRIPLDVTKEKYELIASAAAAQNEKVNGYTKKAIDERMERDNKALSSTAAPAVTKQQTIPNQTVISSTAASGNTSQKPRKPFTKKAAEQAQYSRQPETI